LVVKYISRVIWLVLFLLIAYKSEIPSAFLFLVITFLLDKLLHFITTSACVNLCDGNVELYWAVVHREVQPPSRLVIVFFWVDVFGSLGIPLLVSSIFA